MIKTLSRSAMRNVPSHQDVVDDERNPGLEDKPDPKPPDPLRGSPKTLCSWLEGQRGYSEPKHNPTVFAGTSNPEAYLIWVRSMEELFDNHNYPEAKKVEVATNQLKGDAKFWWSVETTRRYHYNPASSWKDMKHHMKRRYVPPNFPEHIERYYDYKKSCNKSLKTRKLSPQGKKRFVHTKQDLVTNNYHAPFNLDKVSSQCLTTSITHLTLSKESETGSGIKPKLKDATMSDKQDPSKKMKVLVQKPTQDIHGSLLVKEQDLTAHIHANPSETKQQDKCINPYLASEIESLCYDADVTNLRPKPHENKEHAKVEQLKIQNNKRDSIRVDQIINMEQRNNFKTNQNQGVLYSLLIKEAHPSSNKMIMPNLIKSEGKLLNSHFYNDTNLLFLHVGKTVLRSKLCQERGYDEVIQTSISHGPIDKEIKQSKDAKELEDISFLNWRSLGLPYLEVSKLGTTQSFVWRPGELLIQLEPLEDFTTSHNHHWISWIQPIINVHYLKIFGPIKENQNIPSGLDEFNILDTLKEVPRHHTYLPKLSRYKATHTKLRPRRKPQLHSFSLNCGFIPMGFPGKVFNEAIASQGDTLAVVEGYILSQDHTKGVKTKKNVELLHFGDDRELSLYSIGADGRSMIEDPLNH